MTHIVLTDNKVPHHANVRQLSTCLIRETDSMLQLLNIARPVFSSFSSLGSFGFSFCSLSYCSLLLVSFSKQCLVIIFYLNVLFIQQHLMCVEVAMCQTEHRCYMEVARLEFKVLTQYNQKQDMMKSHWQPPFYTCRSLIDLLFLYFILKKLWE